MRKANLACLLPEATCCITEKMLKKAVLDMASKVEAGLALSKQGVTLSYDSWTDVSHDQLLALAATTSSQPRQVRTEWFASVFNCNSNDSGSSSSHAALEIMLLCTR